MRACTSATLHEALSRAETRASSSWWRVRHPVRWLRPSLCSVAHPVIRRCTLFTGQDIKVAVPEIVGKELYRFGYIEPGVTRVLLDCLRPGMVFFDVGAQYGYHTLVASLLVGEKGTIVAFEPGRTVRGLLLANTAHMRNVRIEAAALHAESREMELTDFGIGYSALNTLLSTARVPVSDQPPVESARYLVPTTTVDEYIAQTGLLPDVVKIDAEGSEVDILAGMRGLLAGASPLVTLETGDYAHMESPATTVAIDFLQDYGYQPLEYIHGLRPHRRRTSYGYDNLFFTKRRVTDSA